MRQAGILAACGIVSLTQYVDRLADDHRRARAMAERLSHISGLEIRWDTVQTNILLIWTEGPAQPWADAIEKEGVLCPPVGANRLRAIFHADIDDQKLERAAAAFESVAKR